MRKQTEILLVAKRPHLFHESILNGLSIPTDNQAPSQDKEIRSRWGYKEENFFDCGEGWLPIIAAFTESLDHFISEYETSTAEDGTTTEQATVLINGAISNHHRLCIVIDRSSEFDDVMLSKIRAMQEFATAMSGFICESCGTPVKETELHSRVQCAVCHCRHS